MGCLGIKGVRAPAGTCAYEGCKQSAERGTRACTAGAQGCSAAGVFAKAGMAGGNILRTCSENILRTKEDIHLASPTSATFAVSSRVSRQLLLLSSKCVMRMLRGTRGGGVWVGGFLGHNVSCYQQRPTHPPSHHPHHSTHIHRPLATTSTHFKAR